MAFKKVGVDAVCAVVALTPDLQTSESLRKTTRKEKTRTWHIIKVRTQRTARKVYERTDAESTSNTWLTRSLGQSDRRTV
jgi:hypothetical protein